MYYHNDPDVSSFRVGNTRYQTNTGLPLAIYNVDYLAKGESSQEMADDFIKNNRKILGLSGSSKTEGWEFSSSTTVGIWTTVRYKQTVNHIEVYDSSIAITINDKNVVRMVSGTYKKGIHLDAHQIIQKSPGQNILSKMVGTYGKKSYQNIRNYSIKQVIYQLGKNDCVLAWQVNFSIEGEDFIEVEVVYDDDTDSILLEVDKTLDKIGAGEKRQLNRKYSSSKTYSKENEHVKERDFLRTSKSQQFRSDESEGFNEDEKRMLQVDDFSTLNDDVPGTTDPVQSNESDDPIECLSQFLEDLIANESTQSLLLQISDLVDTILNYLIINNDPDISTSPPQSSPGFFESPMTPSPTVYPTFHPIEDEMPIAFVFDTDPLSTARAKYCDEGFCDNNDKNSEQLTAQLQLVELKDVSFTDGIYQLNGPFAQIVDKDGPFEGLFEQKSNDFRFPRNHPGFEAVNTYYHIDHMLRYLNDELKIFVFPYQYDGGAKFDPHSGLQDNSYYSRSAGTLHFGVGGVDDAEDSDVIIHELGHGIHDWITRGGISQEDGLSEGFGDYIAASYSRSKNLWTSDDEEYQWVFNWDGHNEFSNGRFTETFKRYPEDLKEGRIHENGSIWASCTMKIWDKLGRRKSDKVHVVGLSATGSLSNQEDAANALYLAASDLGYSPSEIQDIREIFVQQGYRVNDGVCGDSEKNEFEECDKFDIGNATCLNVGCSGGTPSCTLDCRLDYSACVLGENDIKFDLEIGFDSFANETSWVLSRESDGMIMRSGGEGIEYDNLNGDIVMTSGCLAPDQCYVLTIHDSQGDGLCCGWGSGHYNVWIDGIAIHDTNPAFESSISHYIGSNCPPLNRCGDGVKGRFEECDGVDFGRAKCADSGCSGGFLRCTSGCKIDYSQCSASESEFTMEVQIKFDDSPWETSWTISMLDFTIIESGGFGEEYNHLGSKFVSENFCLPSDRCYKFDINDSYGDGLCCKQGIGDYSVLIDGTPIPDTNPQFNIIMSHYFGADCPDF